MERETVEQNVKKAYHLIKAGKHADARQILKHTDHPKAKEILAKLDTRYPEKPRSRVPVIVILVIAVAAVIGVFISNSPQNSMLITQTSTSEAPASVTPQADPRAKFETFCITLFGNMHPASTTERRQAVCQDEADYLMSTYSAEMLVCSNDHIANQEFLACLGDEGVEFSEAYVAANFEG